MTPREAEIAALLPLVGWHRASWQRPHLTLLPGMQIDLGGIGKEYAVDRAVDIATRLVSRAVLVNFGGDLAVSGARSGSTPWRVGVEAIAPELAAGPPIDLYAGGLATSGDTYRFVQAGTQRLPHILDPRSGRPVAGAPRSVTVAAASCTMAGMFATLAMLQGEHAERFLDEEGVQYRIQRSPAALV
jgi:FAD:protein FMN transferase